VEKFSLDVVPDRVQQVGLAEAGVPVDEKWVVGAPRGFGDGLGSGVGQAIRRSGHEVLEGEAGIEGDGRVFPVHIG